METPRLSMAVVVGLICFVGLCNAMQWLTQNQSLRSDSIENPLGCLLLFEKSPSRRPLEMDFIASVLTSIVPGAGPLYSSSYFVRLYLPVKFQADPPTLLPKLDLEPYSWDSRCVAVRKFSGFARDDNIVEEAEKLAISLARSPWANSISSETSCGYSIA